MADLDWKAISNRVTIPDTIYGKQWRGVAQTNSNVMSKTELIDIVQRTCRVKPCSGWTKKILMTVRRVFHLVVSVQRRYRIHVRSQTPHNTNCPITKEALQHPMFVRTNSKKFRRGFSLKSIARYIIATGNTRDPCENEQFTSLDLACMQTMCNENNIHLDGPLVMVTSDATQLEYKLSREASEILDIRTEALIDLFHHICLHLQNFTSNRIDTYTSRCATILLPIAVNEGMEKAKRVIEEVEQSTTGELNDTAQLYVRTFTQEVLGIVIRAIERNETVHQDEMKTIAGHMPHNILQILLPEITPTRILQLMEYSRLFQFPDGSWRLMPR